MNTNENVHVAFVAAPGRVRYGKFYCSDKNYAQLEKEALALILYIWKRP